MKGEGEDEMGLPRRGPSELDNRVPPEGREQPERWEIVGSKMVDLLGGPKPVNINVVARGRTLGPNEKVEVVPASELDAVSNLLATYREALERIVRGGTEMSIGEFEIADAVNAAEAALQALPTARSGE